MTELLNHQFEILPTDDALNGFVFGIHASVSVDGPGFDPGENNWITQDGQNSRRGVAAFGRDIPGPKTWTWSSHVNEDDIESALATLDEFDAAWHPEELARTPGALTAIRYRIGNRYRRVFGRPRRFAAPPSNLILSGYVPVTHDFQCVDSYTYDDEESMVVLTLNSGASGGGLTLPTTFPAAIAVPEDLSGINQVVVGGRARAYPIIRFDGPWTNPLLETDDWTLRLNTEIPDTGWINVDTRPWKLTVLDHNGASRVGALPHNTWLEDCYFGANTQPQLRVGGSSAGGQATIRWRNTWKSL